MGLKYVLLFLTITCFVTHKSSARELLPDQLRFDSVNQNGTAAQGNCWSAMMEVKSCGNEIVAYFTNGTTDIGPPCCQAIETIMLHCWPAMLNAIGFTPEEGNILRGYCDASAAASISVPPSSPARSPAVPSPLPQPGKNKGMVNLVF